MIIRTLSRLIIVQTFALSVLMLVALHSPVWAQNAVPDIPAATTTASHAKSTFNHSRTDFELKGAHLSVSCESCHIGGTFKGTPKDCAGCHSAGRQVTALPKPLTHILTNRACDVCHVDQASFKTYVMDHTGMTEPCAVCHSGRYSASIKSSPADFLHKNTTASCDTCHKNTYTFTHAAFNHSNATTNCASCHNGLTAPGKPAAHIVTSAPCETCHTPAVTPGWPMPTSFLGATFDHAGITTNCVSCHSGSLPGVMGKPTTHIPTNAACETCHSPTHTSVGGFTLWTMSHAGITSGCATCHAAGLSFANNGPTQLVMLSTSIHVPVGNVACELCHSPTATNTGGFNSGWVMGAAGHALVSGTPCATCHADSAPYTGVVKQNSIIPHLPTTAACDSCHTSTNTKGYTTFMGAMGAHTSNPVPSLGATCLVCHGGGTPGTVGTGGGKNMIANHLPIGALDCSACHSYTTFVLGSAAAAATPTHTAVTGTACSTCHNAGLGYVGISGGKPVVTKPVSHIPTTAACNTCHTSLTAPGGFTTWTMSHVGITSGCATCHGAGKSFTNNGGTPLVTLSTTIHVPVGTTACELCHSPTGTGTGGFNSGWVMGTTGHALVSATPCATCHADSTPYTGVVKQNSIISHIPTSAACDTCHTATNTGGYANFLNAIGTHLSNPVPSLGATCLVCHGGGTPGTVGTGGGKNMIANHIPIGALDCSACHSYTTFVLGSAAAAATPTHTATTGTACATCHNAGLSYVGIFGGTPVVTKPTSHIPTAAACNTCHTSQTAPGGFTTWTMSHVGITSGCATCHGAGKSFTNNGGTPLVTLSTTIHVPVGATACETCHSSSATAVGNFSSAWTMGLTGHTAVLGATPLCATCHGLSASYTGVKKIDSAHIPSSYYPVEDCGVCHTASTTGNYSLGGFTLLVGSGLPMHTNILTGCAPCHNNTIAKGTASFPSHIAIGTADCSNCHTPSNTSTYTTFLGATGGHTAPSAPGQCLNSGCHVAGGAGKIYTNPPHIPVPGIECDVCHTTSYTSLSFLTYDSTKIHSAVGGIACATCHNGSYTSQGTTGAETTTFIANHIPTLIIGAAVSTTSTCNTCHSGTTNWTTMTSTTAIHNGAQGGGPVYCVTCHLTAGTYMEPAGFQAKNHNGASTAKDCSSAGCHKPKGNTGSSYVTWSN